MSTVKTLIDAAARKLGLGPLTSAESTDALVSLNAMLDLWAADPQGVFKRVLDSFTLTVADADYSYAAAGDLASARPVDILTATIRDSANIDYPVQILSPPEYEGIPLKSTPGRPRGLYYDRQYPTGYVYLYPTPDYAYTLRLQTRKAIAAYTALTDSSGLPLEYESAIIFNLAIELAPEFGLEPSAVVVARASAAYRLLTTRNAYDNLPRIRTDVIGSAGGNGRVYDIDGDFYY